MAFSLRFLIVTVVAGQVDAGQFVPYDVVVFKNENVISRIDMDSGAETIIRSDKPSLGSVLATTSNEIFALGGGTIAGEGRFWRFNARTGEGQVMFMDDGLIGPADLEITHDGRFFATDMYSGIFEIDIKENDINDTEEVAICFECFEEPLLQVRYGTLEIDSSDTFLFTSLVQFESVKEIFGLFRYPPKTGSEPAELLDIGVHLSDFDLISDTTLIGIGQEEQPIGGGFGDQRTLYKVDLTSGTSSVLLESDVLRNAGRIQVDPDGRIVILAYQPTRIVRLNLEIGRTEVLPLGDDAIFASDMDLLVIREGPLQAGDADQDLDFDQFDLIQVQKATKYLTAQVATWGEGDWNEAPGGRPGNPPPGDRVFNQLDIMAALKAGKYLTGPYAAVRANGQQNDGQTSIVYDATNGEVAVDAPAGTPLTSINIDSTADIFTGAPAQNLGGSFDNDADNNIFKGTFGSSFGSLSFGTVAQPGLTQQFVLNDLTVVGSLAGGGALGEVDLIYVPEPTALLLLSLGLLSVGGAAWAKGPRASPKQPNGM